MKPQHNNLYGITFMIVNIISVAILYAVFKTVSKTMPSTQAVFLYKLLLLICITPWALSNGLKGLKTPQLKLHMIRGFFSTGGGLCFMYGLKHVDLANASALQYLQHVIVISIGFIYFKEKITKTKIAGIIMSFSAAILIVFPNLITDLRNFFNSDLAKNNDFNYYYLFIRI